MIIYRLDVDKFEYELVEPGAAPHEEYSKKRDSVSNAVVMLVTVERNDTGAIADQAIGDVLGFMSKIKASKLLIYPFTLSTDPAGPKEAIAMMDRMRGAVPGGIKAERAPFGWIAKVSMSIKGNRDAQALLSYSFARERINSAPAGEQLHGQRHKPE